MSDSSARSRSRSTPRGPGVPDLVSEAAQEICSRSSSFVVRKTKTGYSTDEACSSSSPRCTSCRANPRPCAPLQAREHLRRALPRMVDAPRAAASTSTARRRHRRLSATNPTCRTSDRTARACASRGVRAGRRDACLSRPTTRRSTAHPRAFSATTVARGVPVRRRIPPPDRAKSGRSLRSRHFDQRRARRRSTSIIYDCRRSASRISSASPTPRRRRRSPPTSPLSRRSRFIDETIAGGSAMRGPTLLGRRARCPICTRATGAAPAAERMAVNTVVQVALSSKRRWLRKPRCARPTSARA